MDIKTFVKVAQSLPADNSVLIRGEHGIGKSEVISQLASHFSLPLIDRRISQLSEGDIIGLPKLDGETTKFMPPDWILQACREPVMLFLDEINRGTQEVMQACFQLVLDRQLQGHRLHAGTRVYAAINTGGNYQVNEMDPAFIDRFVMLDFTPSDDDFFAHWENPNGYKGRTPMNSDCLRFLKERTSRLKSANVNPGTKQPSPRSWTRLDACFKANGIYDQNLKEDPAAKGTAYSLALGYIGVEASNDFIDYLSNRTTRFNAEHVVDEYPKHRATITEIGRDKLINLVDLICEWSKTNMPQKTQAENMGLFVKDLPAELRVNFLVSFTKAIRPLPNFEQKLQAIHPYVVKHVVEAFNSEGKLKSDDELAAEDGTATKKKAPSKKK